MAINANIVTMRQTSTNEIKTDIFTVQPSQQACLAHRQTSIESSGRQTDTAPPQSGG